MGGTIRVTSIDVRSLKLSPEQGFVLSRIDGNLSLRELVALCGAFDEGKVTEIVRALAEMGAVVVDDPDVVFGGGQTGGGGFGDLSLPEPPPPPPPSSTSSVGGAPSSTAPVTLASAVSAPPPIPPSPPSSQSSPRPKYVPPPPPPPPPGPPLVESPTSPPASSRPRMIRAASAPPQSRPSVRLVRPAIAHQQPSGGGSGPPTSPSPSHPPIEPLAVPPSQQQIPPTKQPPPHRVIQTKQSSRMPAAPPVPPPPSSSRPVPPPPPPAPPGAQLPSASSSSGSVQPPLPARAPIQLGLAVSGMTELGLVRTNNEDSYAVVNLTSKTALEIDNKQQILACGGKGVLLIVADGAGAEKAGEIASEIVVTVMREHMMNALDQENGITAIEEHLADAVRAAHRRVVDEAAQGVNLTGMASTVVAIVLLGDTAHVVEIGDSRVYLYRAGKLTQVTKDQNQAQMLIDAGVLSPQDAKSSLARNILLQAMGKSEELIVVQRKLTLRDGDRFLLCSDGLTSHVPDPDISNIIGSTVLLNEICSKLVALTLERGARDNVTVVMCHVTGPLLPPNEAENAQDTIQTLRDFSFTPAE